MHPYHWELYTFFFNLAFVTALLSKEVASKPAGAVFVGWTGKPSGPANCKPLLRASFDPSAKPGSRLSRNIASRRSVSLSRRHAFPKAHRPSRGHPWVLQLLRLKLAVTKDTRKRDILTRLEVLPLMLVQDNLPTISFIEQSVALDVTESFLCIPHVEPPNKDSELFFSRVAWILHIRRSGSGLSHSCIASISVHHHSHAKARHETTHSHAHAAHSTHAATHWSHHIFVGSLFNQIKRLRFAVIVQGHGKVDTLALLEAANLRWEYNNIASKNGVQLWAINRPMPKFWGHTFDGARTSSTLICQRLCWCKGQVGNGLCHKCRGQLWLVSKQVFDDDSQGAVIQCIQLVKNNILHGTTANWRFQAGPKCERFPRQQQSLGTINIGGFFLKRKNPMNSQIQGATLFDASIPKQSFQTAMNVTDILIPDTSGWEIFELHFNVNDLATKNHHRSLHQKTTFPKTVVNQCQWYQTRINKESLSKCLRLQSISVVKQSGPRQPTPWAFNTSAGCVKETAKISPNPPAAKRCHWCSVMGHSLMSMTLTIHRKGNGVLVS